MADLARAQKWLVLCPIHDAGITGICRCPEGDPRTVIQDLLAEVELLRSALTGPPFARDDTLKALLAGTRAESDRRGALLDAAQSEIDRLAALDAETREGRHRCARGTKPSVG